MLTSSFELYAYALYIVLLGSASSNLYVIHQLRGHKLPIVSLKLFQAYFIAGIFGWSILAYKDLTHNTIDIAQAAASYVLANFILLIAVVECVRNKLQTGTLSLVHLLLILTVFLFDQTKDILLLTIIYSLVVMPIIFLVSMRKAIRNENIGNVIIAIASFVVIAAIPIELQQIFYQDDINNAFTLILITAAAGFVLVGTGFLTSILITEHQQLTSLALNDPLTGLLNRRGLDFEIRPVLAATKRNNKNMSLIAIDIDFFKKINDQYGHDGGDLVLKEVAEILSSCPRESDICCRLGGEEFLIILPDTELEPALSIAERIRSFVEQAEISYDTETIKLTASFGVASENTNIDINRLLKAADKALYKAKEEGRNCVRRAF